MNITIGETAEAYYQLKQKYGLYYNPSNRELIEYAIKLKQRARLHELWFIIATLSLLYIVVYIL